MLRMNKKTPGRKTWLTFAGCLPTEKLTPGLCWALKVGWGTRREGVVCIERSLEPTAPVTARDVLGPVLLGPEEMASE